MPTVVPSNTSLPSPKKGNLLKLNHPKSNHAVRLPNNEEDSSEEVRRSEDTSSKIIVSQNEVFPPLVQEYLQDESNFEHLSIAGSMMSRMEVGQKKRHVQHKMDVYTTQLETKDRIVVENASRRLEMLEEKELKNETILFERKLPVLPEVNTNFAVHDISIQNQILPQEKSTVIFSRLHPQVAAALCHGWVLMTCHVKLCTQRHYFVTQAEKEESVRFKQHHHASLEIRILKNITERQVLLENIQKEAKAVIQKFQDHEGKIRKREVVGLLALMSTVRLSSVKVCESIARWRGHVKQVGWTAIQHGSKNIKERWSVSLTVPGKKKLYGPSPACISKV